MSEASHAKRIQGMDVKFQSSKQVLCSRVDAELLHREEEGQRRGPEGAGGKQREGAQGVRGGGPSDRPTAEAAAGSTREVSPGKSWDSWSDSEDEFFECLSDQGEGEAPHAEGDKEGSKVKAEGRLHPQGNMTLLNSTEPLYIPVTQVSIRPSVTASHTF